MSPEAWLLLGALLLLLLGLAAARTALAPVQPRPLVVIVEPEGPLYRCLRCDGLVVGERHINPFTGRDCS